MVFLDISAVAQALAQAFLFSILLSVGLLYFENLKAQG